MDQDPFTVSLFKWDPRSTVAPPPPSQPPQAPPQLPPYLARGHLASQALGLAGSMGMGIQAGMGMGMGSMGMLSGSGSGSGGGGSGGLEEMFGAYGIRYYTAVKIAEMGFTASTLVDMKEEELDEMMNSLCHLFRWDLLVGERYGIKAAVRAERRRLEELEESRRGGHRHGQHHQLMSFSGGGTPPSDGTHHPLDALSQEGLSEEPGVHEKEVVGSGGGSNWEMVMAANHHHNQERKKQRKQQQARRLSAYNTNSNSHNNIVATLSKKGQAGRVGTHSNDHDDDMEEEEVDDDNDGLDHDGGHGGGGIVSERQREHPFIVTEPGEVARGKKNGLDYLFHLYEQCRDFLLQVQNIAKERGEKCPTKVTNQAFRFAKKAGATYINKPKMRHYVHCYALHCLDEDTSNALRKAFKERGENVGAWRQACYKPLVAIAARQGWDIDAIFNTHPRLSIWYVPTKLRQLCHAERSSATSGTTSSISGSAGGNLHLPF